MKKLLFSFLFALFCLSAHAQKKVYIPKEWATDPALGKWSYDRSYQTPNFVVFWGPKAGLTPKTNPAGSLQFDPKFITDTLEYIYRKYVKEFRVVSDAPDQPLGKYKCIILMSNTWGEGGPTDFAVASVYDDLVPMMAVDKAATLDGGVTSHEFAHCLQFVMKIQDNPAPGAAFANEIGGFFFETHANFMRNQLYPTAAPYDLPRWIGTGSFHWASTRHHYDAYALLFHIQQVDSLNMVSSLWKKSLPNEHPLSTYRRLKKWNQAGLNNFIFDYVKRQVAYDYRINGYDKLYRRERDRLKTQEPHYLWRQYTVLNQTDAALGRYVVPDAFAPQDYGFNIIPLYPTCNQRNVTVKFKGHTEVNDRAGWQYGFVTTRKDGSLSRYSVTYNKPESEVSFQMNAGDEQLYLVVAGAPTIHTDYRQETGWPKIYRYPYELRLANAVPEGYQSTYRSLYKTDGAPHPNGGGWVANSATVSPSVRVGPKAIVRGNAVLSGNVVVDGTAWVENAALSDNARVTGNAMIFSGVYKDNTVVRDNAVLYDVRASATASFKDNTLLFGGTFGGDVVVGGDAEVEGCNKGVYLQMPSYVSNREPCDQKGASDPSNSDVNRAYTLFSNAQMSFAGPTACTGTVLGGLVPVPDRMNLKVYPNPTTDEITLEYTNELGRTTAQIDITSRSGRVVMKSEIVLEEGYSTVTLPVYTLDTDTYIVNLTSTQLTTPIQVKFVKK